MRQDERTRLALLLLPFLIVAVSLAMAQTRRNVLPVLPDVAAVTPVDKIAIAPVPNVVPPPAARIEVPPVTHAPPVPPAAAPAATPPPAVAVEPVAAPVQFPPPVPMIQPRSALPAMAVPPPSVTAPLPAFAQFPPPPAHVEAPVLPRRQTAALDARPPAPPVMPVSPIEAAAVPSTASAEPAHCTPSPAVLASFSNAGRLARGTRVPRLSGIDADTFGKRLAAAALAQTQDLVIYTARYQAMAFPLGDVLALHGACIDVVIRAYRVLGIDLQEEMQRGRPSRGDTNIEHRRTENMRRFLERSGASLPISVFPEDYKPGDIVTYHRPHSRVSTSHIAIVTDVLAPTGRPMIVHNRGYGPQLEDALFVDRITGHYRYMGQPPAAVGSAAAGIASAPAAAAASVVRAGYPSSAGASGLSAPPVR